MASLFLLAASACGYTFVPAGRPVGSPPSPHADVGFTLSWRAFPGRKRKAWRQAPESAASGSAALGVPVVAACLVAGRAQGRATSRAPRAYPPALSQAEKERGWIAGLFDSSPQAPPAVAEEPETELWQRRPVLAAGLLLPWLGAQILVGGKRGAEEGGERKRTEGADRDGDVVDGVYYAGDAVTPPGIESRLIETLDLPPSVAGPVVEQIVLELEELGGTQLQASSGAGRWVLPWVGGWQRLWTNSPDASFLGGPAANAFDSFTEAGARQFVYGPGEGGMIIEYLFASRSSREKYLLSRAASVANLGDRYFQLDFRQPLQAYEVLSAAAIQASKACFTFDEDDPSCSYSGLKSNAPVQVSGAPTAPAASGLVLRTTYLSESLWIVRNERADKVAVFQRSPAQSVMDRRGLVMDKQLNPSQNEQTRYGGLLFSEEESADSYKNWEAKTKAQSAGQDRLLGR